MWHGIDSGMKTHEHILVSEDQSLHQESDPRYRGSHIPSRAFRILQNFTDSSDDGNRLSIGFNTFFFVPP